MCICVFLEDFAAILSNPFFYNIITLGHAPEQAVAKVVLLQLFNWNFSSVGESLSVPLSNSTPPTCL